MQSGSIANREKKREDGYYLSLLLILKDHHTLSLGSVLHQEMLAQLITA